MQSSDVWVLLSILLGGGQHETGATLHTIIRAGDAINHSILTYEELASGLNRLTAGDYIYEENEKFFATKKAKQLLEEARLKSQNVFEIWECVSGAMGAAEPYAGTLLNPNNNLTYPGITPELVVEATNKWHNEAEEWTQKSLQKNR